MIVGDGISPAEAIAASMCWLARFRHGDAAMIGEVNLDNIGYWHRAGCRFCTKPMNELVTTFAIGRCEKGSMAAFNALSKSARAARIREAQEVPWYEQLE
jgi:hypothetical protein